MVPRRSCHARHGSAIEADARPRLEMGRCGGGSGDSQLGWVVLYSLLIPFADRVPAQDRTLSVLEVLKSRNSRSFGSSLGEEERRSLIDPSSSLVVLASQLVRFAFQGDVEVSVSCPLVGPSAFAA